MRKLSKRLLQDSVKIDLTPLIDCVFLLIVFFIVAGKFKKVESRLDAYLPKDMGLHPAETLDPDKFYINVLCLGDKDQIQWKLNDFTVDTRGDLVKKLKEIAGSVEDKKDIKVFVDGQAGVHFYWVIAALDACAEAQLYEIILSPPRVALANWPQPWPRNIPPPSE